MKKSLTILSTIVVLLAAFALVWNAQVSATPVLLAPLPQFFATDNSGRPLAFGCVFTYISGTTTPLATYTDSTGNTQNPNPVVLSASGNANIWMQAGQAYTFRVKSAGGTNCVSGTTRYTVNGISGGSSQLSTNVSSSATPQFTAIAQNQLFIFTLTSNTVALPLVVTNVQAPAFITFKIIQTGGFSFTWPTNTIGGGVPSQTGTDGNTQTFIWNGTKATAVGPMLTGQVLAGITAPGPRTNNLNVDTNASVGQNLTVGQFQFAGNANTTSGFAGPGTSLVTTNAGTGGIPAKQGVCGSNSGLGSVDDCGFMPTAIIECGGTGTCANAVASQPRVIMGTRVLSGGTATVSGISPPFGAAGTFVCVANDITGLNTAYAQPTGANSIVLFGGGASDTLAYICVGHNP